MSSIRSITPCLWFNDQAEEAAKFYTGIFKSSKIIQVIHYTKAGQEIHKKPPGSVMTIIFELEGHRFTALNGGPHFKFNEAISFEIRCETQEEIDYFWEKLSAGGDPKAQQCGWLKDRFGVSWQVVASAMDQMFDDPVTEKTERAMSAMMKMKKLDLAALQRTYEGS